MAWIESHQTLRDHPKLYKIVDSLQISKPQAVGHLHLFWYWCVDYAPEGVLKSFSDIQIARASCWESDAKMFVTALIDAGFIDRKDGVLTVHDWLDFCGAMIEKRLQRMAAKRQTTAPNGVLPTQPTVPNQPTELKGAQKFVPPKAWEVTEYAKEQGYALDGQKFLDYYEARGWMVKGTRIKSWKACVRTWKGNETLTPAAKYEDVKLKRKEAWIRAGLSKCHGSTVTPDDDGVPRCDSCTEPA